MKILVQVGERLTIGLLGEDGLPGDGEFTLDFEPATMEEKGVVRISADMEDSKGRLGVIYEERFGGPWKRVKGEETAKEAAVRIGNELVEEFKKRLAPMMSQQEK